MLWKLLGLQRKLDALFGEAWLRLSLVGGRARAPLEALRRPEN